MFTLFHAFVVVGVLAGLALGIAGGFKLSGVLGGIFGGLIGGYAGFIAGRLPELLVLRSVSRSLEPRTTDDLRTFLRKPECLIHNIVLLELLRRGEDIDRELGLVLDLLVSENAASRGHGWAALMSAFPKLALQVSDYRVKDSVAECRRKTEGLRDGE